MVNVSQVTPGATARQPLTLSRVPSTAHFSRIPGPPGTRTRERTERGGSGDGAEELGPALAVDEAVVAGAGPDVGGAVGKPVGEVERHLRVEDVVGVAVEELDVVA